MMNLIGKISTYVPNRRAQVLTGLVIAILISLYFVGIFSAPINGDTYKLLTASNSPNMLSVDYWLHIFIRPNHAQYQYRPISYFTYLFLVGLISKSSPIFLHVLGMAMFLATVCQLVKLAKLLFSNNLMVVISVVLYIAYPLNYYMLANTSFHAKYFLPLFFLLYSINRVVESQITRKKQVVMTILMILAIMAHEGGFVFPVIILMFARTFQKTPYQKFLPIFFPSLIYLIARFFLFRVPSSGFLKVGLNRLFASFDFYLNEVLLFEHFPRFNSLFIPLIVFCILGVISAYIYLRKNNQCMVLMLISMMLVIAPFLLIANHIISGRAYWASPFVAIFITYLVSSIKYHRIKIAVSVCMSIYLLAYSFKYFDYSKYNLEVQKVLDEIDQGHNLGPTKTISFTLKVMEDNSYFEFGIIPGILALYRPNYTFYIPVIQKNDKKGYMYIKNGFVYYHIKDNKWVDTFWYYYSIDPVQNSTLNDLALDTTELKEVARGETFRY